MFADHAIHVAPLLLGSYLSVDSDEGTVTLRITEVEAYHGVGTPGPYDAGSHSKDRKTDRNASMFGPPGHAYVYFSYGMHFALNLVCSPEGVASGCLIRGGEVVEGEAIASRRRIAKRHGTRITAPSSAVPGAPSTAPLSIPEITRSPVPAHALARGPGNVATALGITRETHDGQDLFAAPFQFESVEVSRAVSTGPRVGVSGVAGGPEFPWRFWLTGDPTVSAFRPGRGAPQ